jgi:hypothetical protein
MTDRLIVEKYMYGGWSDLKVDDKALKHMYRDHKPKLIKQSSEECMTINGTLLIDVVDREKSKHSMEEKILDIEHHRGNRYLGTNLELGFWPIRT